MPRFGWMCRRKLSALEFPDGFNVAPAVSQPASIARNSPTGRSARTAKGVWNDVTTTTSGCCKRACANTTPKPSRLLSFTGKCRSCEKLTATVTAMRCLPIYRESLKIKFRHDPDQERQGNRKDATVVPHRERGS